MAKTKKMTKRKITKKRVKKVKPVYTARCNDDGSWAVILVNGKDGEVVCGVSRGSHAQKTAEKYVDRLQNGEESI